MHITVMPESTPGNANFNSASIKTDKFYKSVGLQIAWTGFNATNAVVSIWESNDNVTFTENTAASYTIEQAAGSAVIPMMGGTTCQYYQVRFTKNSNSAGSISGIINFTE